MVRRDSQRPWPTCVARARIVRDSVAARCRTPCALPTPSFFLCILTHPASAAPPAPTQAPPTMDISTSRPGGGADQDADLADVDEGQWRRRVGDLSPAPAPKPNAPPRPPAAVASRLRRHVLCLIGQPNRLRRQWRATSGRSRRDVFEADLESAWTRHHGERVCGGDRR